MPSLPSPIVTRSNISVVSAVPQPLPTPPTTAPSSSARSSKKTSLNSASPEIWRSPRTVTPSASIGTMNIVRPFVLRHVRVGPGEQQPVGGELRVGRPDLLARQAPAAVLLLAGARLHRRQVGARGGLGEQLAPDLVAVQQRRQVAALLLVGAVGDDRRPEHPDADRVEDPGHFRASDLLVDDHLLDRAEALAAVLLGPGHTGEPALGELALPGATGGDQLVLVLDRVRSADDGSFVPVLVEPAAHLRAVCALLGRVVEIHGSSFG